MSIRKITEQAKVKGYVTKNERLQLKAKCKGIKNTNTILNAIIKKSHRSLALELGSNTAIFFKN